jgi:MFS transporter, DHA2 family, multidrug resistance protein
MIAEVESSTQWRPKSNPWLIAATVALAAFMEVLDTSIANVALPHIAGDLAWIIHEGGRSEGLLCYKHVV